MRLAQTLQQTLIPPTPPHVPGRDVAAAYRPAGDGAHVGGDFYDVFQVSTDDWVVVLGDVQGKGADAAAVTALARHTVLGVFAAPEFTETEVVLQHGDALVLFTDGVTEGRRRGEFYGAGRLEPSSPSTPGPRPR